MAVFAHFQISGESCNPNPGFHMYVFSQVHLEYFYIYIVNFRRMASGAFCDEEDVLEIYKFSSSSDSDDDPDE